MNTEARENLQTFPTAVLAAIVRGEVDLAALVRGELASRGCDASGKWVGFEAAKRRLGLS